MFLSKCLINISKHSIASNLLLKSTITEWIPSIINLTPTSSYQRGFHSKYSSGGSFPMCSTSRTYSLE